MASRHKQFANLNDRRRDFSQQLDDLIAPMSGSRPVAMQDIPVEQIGPNPFQPRHNFKDIEELASSIRQHGFTTRLRVRPDSVNPGQFQLVFGERRLRAASAAGLTVVPCDIAEHSDAEMIEIGLTENIQRLDLTPLEEARAFQRFIEQHGYTQQSLAQRIGKDHSYVESRLSLLRAPEDVQAMVEQRPDTIRAARAIASLPDPEARRPLIEGVLNKELSKEVVVNLVKDARLRRETPEPTNPPWPESSPTTDTTISQGQSDPPAVDQSTVSPAAVTVGKALRQRTTRTAGAEARLNEALDRDERTLDLIWARLRGALPAASTEQRRRIRELIDKQLVVLEALQELAD